MACYLNFELDTLGVDYGSRVRAGKLSLLDIDSDAEYTWSQLHAMMFSYTALIKDKEIIAAEVMNEYNEGVSTIFRIIRSSVCANVSSSSSIRG